MIRYLRTTLAGIAGMAVLLSIGCSDDQLSTYPVEGKIVYPDGSPVPGKATVAFHTEVDGVPYSALGRVREDGTFRLTTFREDDGAIAGEHRVSVAAIPGGDEDTGPPVLAERFAMADTSGLTATVQVSPPEGVNTVVLTVEKPAGVRR